MFNRKFQRKISSKLPNIIFSQFHTHNILIRRWFFKCLHDLIIVTRREEVGRGNGNGGNKCDEKVAVYVQTISRGKIKITNWDITLLTWCSMDFKAWSVLTVRNRFFMRKFCSWTFRSCFTIRCRLSSWSRESFATRRAEIDSWVRFINGSMYSRHSSSQLFLFTLDIVSAMFASHDKLFSVSNNLMFSLSDSRNVDFRSRKL